jgi:hypothetical protein
MIMHFTPLSLSPQSDDKNPSIPASCHSYIC